MLAGVDADRPKMIDDFYSSPFTSTRWWRGVGINKSRQPAWAGGGGDGGGGGGDDDGGDV